jgi:hypothetical protein
MKFLYAALLLAVTAPAMAGRVCPPPDSGLPCVDVSTTTVSVPGTPPQAPPPTPPSAPPK